MRTVQFLLMIIVAGSLASLSAHAQQRTSRGSSYGSAAASNSSPGLTGYFPLGMKHEIDINLSKGVVHSYKVGTKSYTDIDLVGTYSHSLGSGLQILAEAGITAWPDSAGDRKPLLTLMGGVTYNFNPDLVDAVFAQAAIGMMPASEKDKVDYSSKFSFFVGAGKRFTLFHRVSAKPLVRLYKRGDMDMDYVIMPFNISMFF